MLQQKQIKTFKNAESTIYLTEFARDLVQQKLGSPTGKSTVINHGVAERFRQSPRPQLPPSEYSNENPYKILYVSIINLYKHQWNVVEAVGRLRDKGLPIELDLIGPYYARALKRLKKTKKYLPQDKK